MRCRYRETVYRCGDYLEAHIYPVYRSATSRRKKLKPTPETQQRLNEKRAEGKFIRILNANFGSDDLKVELTYKPECLPESDEEAAKELRNFLRRVKRYRERNGLSELKYVAVTEKGSRSGRYHHHLVLNGGVPLRDLVELWGKGIVGTDLLQLNENGLADLGVYMLKQARGLDFLPGKRKWTSSKNLVHPEPRQRDGRFSKRQVRELAKDPDDRTEFGKLYPGYLYSQAKVVYSDVNGGWYIYARYYREEAEFLRKRKKTSSRSRSCAGRTSP